MPYSYEEEEEVDCLFYPSTRVTLTWIREQSDVNSVRGGFRVYQGLSGFIRVSQGFSPQAILHRRTISTASGSDLTTCHRQGWGGESRLSSIRGRGPLSTRVGDVC